MGAAVDKMMEARNYDGVASKMKSDTTKQSAQGKSTKDANAALKSMFPFMADYSK